MEGSSTGAVREYLARRKDGTVFPCIVYYVTISDMDGTPVGIRGILTDITNRKLMEEEINRINRELEVYAEVVSHDLRGPISVIQSASIKLDELMERCADPDTAGIGMKIVHIIGKSAENAVALINDLLTLARAGQVTSKVFETDVRGIVDKVLEENAAPIEERDIKVAVDEDLGHIMADPTQLYQIFTNLIRNAIAYNDNPEPEIRVTHQEEKGVHIYKVRDNGSGIPPDEVEEIFLPLHRGKTGGTGIGLSIVYKLVSLYRGEIRAYNDGGACFEFTLMDL
jgi:signal transduction histidine kinase